jgi:hypothetical protein
MDNNAAPDQVVRARVHKAGRKEVLCSGSVAGRRKTWVTHKVIGFTVVGDGMARIVAALVRNISIVNSALERSRVLPAPLRLKRHSAPWPEYRRVSGERSQCAEIIFRLEGLTHALALIPPLRPKDNACRHLAGIYIQCFADRINVNIARYVGCEQSSGREG